MEPDFSARAGADTGLQTERRIAWLTLLIGLMAGAAAAIAGNWFWASGLVIGGALAWLGFRWLREGFGALGVAATAPAGAGKTPGPGGACFSAGVRHALLTFFLCGIFFGLSGS